MQKWARLLIEIYQPDAYEGRWVIENGELGLDLDYVKNCVRSLRKDERYEGAALQVLDDGQDCVIGVFCGRDPPTAPTSGRILPPEVFVEVS